MEHQIDKALNSIFWKQNNPSEVDLMKDKKERFLKAKKESEKIEKILSMLQSCHYYYETTIGDSIKYPHLFQHFQSRSQHWKKVIERLEKYFNTTVNEIML